MRFAALRGGVAGGQIIHRLFVQQKFGCHYPRMGMEPLLNNAICEEVSN